MFGLLVQNLTHDSEPAQVVLFEGRCKLFHINMNIQCANVCSYKCFGSSPGIATSGCKILGQTRSRLRCIPESAGECLLAHLSPHWIPSLLVHVPKIAIKETGEYAQK